MNCDKCGAITTTRSGQRHHYSECGLNNVYLDNVELIVCDACGAIELVVPKIKLVHKTIARAIALQPYALSGSEARFLRKHLRFKAKEWAALLRVDEATLGGWENDEQAIGLQSDILIRLLYFRMLEEKEGQLIPEPVAAQIAAATLRRTNEAAVFVNLNDPTTYSYQHEKAIA